MMEWLVDTTVHFRHSGDRDSLRLSSVHVMSCFFHSKLSLKTAQTRDLQEG